MNKRKRSLCYFAAAILSVSMAAGAFVFSSAQADPVHGSCRKTVQGGPIALCLPNAATPERDSDQIPPNIPCWYGVNCPGDALPEITTFVAVPNPIRYAAASTLSWTTAYTSMCILRGYGRVPRNGQRGTWALVKSQRYTLTCAGVGARKNSTTTRTVAVLVGGAARPTVTLSLAPRGPFVENRICRGNACTTRPESPAGRLTVVWASRHATSCRLTKNGVGLATGVGGTKQTWAPSPSGFAPFPGTASHDHFRVVCTGPGGTATATARDVVRGVLVTNH